MSRTFKTNKKLRRWTKNKKYSFLFREIIDYTGTNVHWRKHIPYGAKLNTHNYSRSYDSWANNAVITKMNDKDFFCNIRMRINKKSQRKPLLRKIIKEESNL